MSNAKIFDKVKIQKPNRNTFPLDFDVKTSAVMGKLIPVFNEEVVTGDYVSLGCDSLLRFAPLLAPVMHNMQVSMHYFFVPFRILWDNFEDYFMNQNPQAHPTLGIDPAALPGDPLAYSELDDYLGLPNPATITATPETETYSAMYHAAYQMIYNEYYRDQNLQGAVNFELTDGDNAFTNPDLKQIRYRAWEHDYFTSALPFAQKGTPVQLPIGQFEDVAVQYNDNPALININLQNATPPPTNVSVIVDPTADVTPGTLYAQTSALTAQAALINDLRTAFRLQEWQEKNARGGTRFNEFLLSHYGTQPSDKRLQRPEYITGTKSPVSISEVLQTSSTDATSPQGNMAGHALSVTAGKYGNYKVEEPGCIMGIMTIMPQPNYFQGTPKKFLKINDCFDYYFPSFAHLGEQEVDTREIYAYQNVVGTPELFGYLPKYAEYKFCSNTCTKDMRTTLLDWHLARDFSTKPALNSAFIECRPSNRIFAVTTGDNIWAHIYHKYKASRLMPVFGTPTF